MPDESTMHANATSLPRRPFPWQWRLIIAFGMLPFLLLALNELVVQRNLPGVILTLGAMLIVAAFLFALARFRISRGCPYCGGPLHGAWCRGCVRLGSNSLLLGPVGTLDLARCNRADDPFLKMLSLVASLAVRDLARTLTLEENGASIELRSLHHGGWVEWESPPEESPPWLVDVLHAVAGAPLIRTGAQSGRFDIVDTEGVRHGCRFTTTADAGSARIRLDFELAPTMPADCQPIA